MNKKLLLSLLSLGVLCAFAQGPITPQRFERGAFHQAISPHKIITKEVKNDNGVENKRINKAKEGQPTYNVDFVLDFDTQKQSASSLQIINHDYLLNEYELVFGSNVVSIPAGTYDMRLQFQQLDTLESNYIYKMVIRENVTIDQDMQLNISANEAINRIHHEMITPEGEPIRIGTYFVDADNNYALTPIDPGNVDDIIYYNMFLCSDYGPTDEINGNVGVKVELNGQMISQGNLAMSDIFVNDVSDRYSFYMYRTAYKGHEVFNSAFETVGVHGDVTFTNDPANYTKYELPFKAPYHHGEDLFPIIRPYYRQNDTYFYFNWGAILDPITESETFKLCLDAKVEDSPVGGFVPFIELSINKEITNDWGDIDYRPVIGTTPITNTDGYALYANNGPSSILSQVYVPFFRWGLNEEGTDDYFYGYWPTHPTFSYPVNRAKGVIGNNCPIFVSDPEQDMEDDLYVGIFKMGYLGRYGDISEGQTDAQVSIKLDGEEIINTQGAFEYYSQTPLIGVVDATITNGLVQVDDLAGSNKAQLHYVTDSEDENPPTMTMLHFKDNNDDVTDRFEIADEGTLEFTAGDFNYITTPWESRVYDRYAPETVEVSYSPYGEDNWNELPVEKVPENYWPVMGWFYTGSLAGVTGEAYEGWFDLKIRLVDAAGNWQEQVLSPAFRIDNLAYSGIATPRGDNAREVARYNLAGQRVDSNAKGVVIVKMSDGTARKVIQ